MIWVCLILGCPEIPWFINLQKCMFFQGGPIFRQTHLENCDSLVYLLLRVLLGAR